MIQIIHITPEEMEKIREQNILRAKDPKFREWYRRVFGVDITSLNKAGTRK